MSMGREYFREYSKRYYFNRKKELIELLGGKCFYCGSDKDLQFHHLYPEKKKCAIGKMVLSKSFEETKKELEGCVLLCEKCHRKVSARQLKERIGEDGLFVGRDGKPYKSCKKVMCVETGKTFESLTMMSRNMGLCESAVSNVCNGKAQTHHGYHFKFV